MTKAPRTLSRVCAQRPAGGGPALPGPLRGCSGAWGAGPGGPTAAAKPGEAVPLPAAQRGPSEKAPAGNASWGCTSPRRVVSGFKRKKQQEQREGGTAPGAQVLGHSGPRGSPTVTHTRSQLRVRSRISFTRHVRKPRLGGREGRRGAHPAASPHGPQAPRGQHSGGQPQDNMSLAQPPGPWSLTVASRHGLPCPTASPRFPTAEMQHF